MKSTLEKPFMKDGICKDIQVINVKLKPSQNLRPGFYHYHNYIEFLYALDTNAYAFINEKKYQFKTGDIIIIPANTPHDIIPIGESNYICIKFLLYVEWYTFLVDDFRCLVSFTSRVRLVSSPLILSFRSNILCKYYSLTFCRPALRDPLAAITLCIVVIFTLC